MKPFQRDAPSSEVARAVEELTAALDPSDRDAYRGMLGRRGDLLRILGRTTEAVADLEASTRLARESGDEQSCAWNLIRLGTARQYAGNHERAVRDLTDAVSAAREVKNLDMEAYARQHLGKCLVECDRLVDAREQFEIARQIRTALDDPVRLASTQRAILAVDRLLEARSD